MCKSILKILLVVLLTACASPGMKELEQKAISGDSDAQYLLGYSYEKGQNNNKNLVEAANWYKKASESGHPRSQHRLGLLYATGRGVEEDFSKTAKLFESAAKQKYDAAQMDYAMLLYGMAPPEYKDEIQAYAWFAVIEANYPAAYQSIKDFKEKLEAKLSAQELQRAKKLGEEYVEKYSP